MRRSLGRSVILFIAAAAVMVSVGCGKRSVGTVNGEKISQEELFKRLQRLSMAQDPLAQLLPPIQQQAASLILNQLIQEKLLLDRAAKEGVSPTEEQVKERKEELQIALEDQNLSLTELMNNSGMSHQELDERLKPSIAQMNILKKYSGMTDEEIKAEVEKQYKNATEDLPADRKNASMFYVPEQAQVFAIVTRDQAKIMEAKKQLDQGVAFTTVARQLSEDPRTKDSGGEVGWIPKPDQFRPAREGVPAIIYSRAFNTPVNTITEPFSYQMTNPATGETTTEWAIMQVKAKREPRMRTLKSVKTEMEMAVIAQRFQSDEALRKKFDEANKKFQEEVTFEVSLPGYRELFKNLEDNLKKSLTNLEQQQPGGPQPAPPGE